MLTLFTKATLHCPLLIEVILTFVFVIAILGVSSKKENGAVSGIVIGLALTLVLFLASPLPEPLSILPAALALHSLLAVKHWHMYEYF